MAYSKKPAHDWKAEQRKFNTWKAKHPTGSLKEYCKGRGLVYATAKHHVLVRVAVKKISDAEQKHVQVYEKEFETQIRKIAKEHGAELGKQISWTIQQVTKTLDPKNRRNQVPKIKNWMDLETAVRVAERLLALVEKLQAVGGGEGAAGKVLSDETIQVIEGLLGFRVVSLGGTDPRFKGKVIDAKK